MLTGSEIRRKFLDYFIQKGHREVHSSSLVPQNDPTLLFTNAGMNQFKDVFLGLEKRDYNKATTSQKCVRAGGKHNDLENVGFTNRHHTFFEMLGNFSFGNYFKKEAIAYAWELITSPEWYGIDKEKLYVTIFKGAGPLEAGFDVPPDIEAEQLWLATGVPKERIFALGMDDNFWQMGDTGPCGPSSEIHYDMGVVASDKVKSECAAGTCDFPCDCGRYVEIWNLVFMQFDRVRVMQQSYDGNVDFSRQGFVETGFKLLPLPRPSIDTGMGLERVTAVLQGVVSNYETDLFTPLIKRAAELTGAKPGLRPGAGEDTRPYANEGKTRVGTGAPPVPAERSEAGAAASLRVIADHSRAATFLISDGVLPSNEGRGYVLRKIIRRAITHGRMLGQTKPFLNEMVPAVRNLMQDAYPELKETTDRVSRAVLSEETRFSKTVEEGLARLEPLVRAAQNVTTHFSDERIRQFIEPQHPESVSEERVRLLRDGLHVLLGEEAFQLYDTFGLPLDFIEEVCRDYGVKLDQEGFDRAMEEQKSLSRASWKGAAKQTANPAYQQLPKSTFEGYHQTSSQGCEVLAIIKAGQGTQELHAGEEGEVILDHTPFYAESGGQVGDRGWLSSNDHNTIIAEVKGCYLPIQGVRAHQVVMKSPPSAKNAEGWGILRVGDKVDAVVNTEIRQATMRNHTATHLLQAGLREILGKHVKQAGSLVAPNHLRFDFSHFASVEDSELQDVEDLINKELLRNQKVEVMPDVPIDVAVNEYKAMALFGEKYGDRVRVVKIGDFSTELCGGTHTAATGEIGLIKILKEGSVSSGIRRIEAVTGEGSLHHFRKDHELEGMVATIAGHSETESPAQALKLEFDKKEAEIKRLQRELDQARMKSASASFSAANIGDKVKEVRGVKVLAHRVDNLERAQMRILVDQMRDKLGSGVVVLGSANNGNVSLIVGVTKDLTSHLAAGKIIAPIAQRVGGKGGGRPDLAEAGGKDPGALDSALSHAYEVVEKLLVDS